MAVCCQVEAQHSELRDLQVAVTRYETQLNEANKQNDKLYTQVNTHSSSSAERLQAPRCCYCCLLSSWLSYLAILLVKLSTNKRQVLEQVLAVSAAECEAGVFQIQELELTASQLDLEHRAELADRDDHVNKLSSDVRVLEERLQQSCQHVPHPLLPLT